MLIFISVNTDINATTLRLTNIEGSKSSITLKGFDQDSKELLIEKDGKDFEYALGDLQFSSKIAVLRSAEMEEILNQKSQLKSKNLMLYGFVILALLALAFIIGFPTFRASAYLITGQEDRGLHFKVWMQILTLITFITVIRILAVGGISWIDVIANGYHLFRAEDGLALLFAIIGTIALVKYQYSETLQLAVTTVAVHFVAFSLVLGGIAWLLWKWNGGDWTTVGDEILTLLILKPFDLV
ncbi:MAG: hypothetical protein QM496_04405 [Verrucomicrobiota bacterium]